MVTAMFMSYFTQCPGKAWCPEGYVPCASKGQCIYDWQLCDGNPDCQDESDETHECVGEKAISVQI